MRQRAHTEAQRHGGRALRVAVVHDWLIRVDGSVRTLAEILRVFPEADVFTLVDALEPEERAFLGGRVPRTSFLRRLPGVRTMGWYYVPMMPAAVEQLDLSGYDLVISSSSGFFLCSRSASDGMSPERSRA